MNFPDKPNCGNCAHMREHEQMGAQGAWCHGDPPKLTMLPGGNRVIAGKPELQGITLAGFWAPVDKEGGWCRLHAFDDQALVRAQ
jgi:hypothetical protein